MEIIYRAFDGKEFHEEEKAIAYEKRCQNTLSMWDGNGTPTTDFTKVRFAWIGDSKALSSFKRGYCHSNHTPWDIKYCGFYYFPYEGHWKGFHISDCFRKTLLKLLLSDTTKIRELFQFYNSKGIEVNGERDIAFLYVNDQFCYQDYFEYCKKYNIPFYITGHRGWYVYNEEINDRAHVDEEMEKIWIEILSQLEHESAFTKYPTTRDKESFEI